jgi:putative transcriptional regulator
MIILLERRCRMVSYEPLWNTMKKQQITTYTLIEKYKVQSKTIYNLKHNKNITTATLETLCDILSCTPNDIIEFKK